VLKLMSCTAFAGATIHSRRPAVVARFQVSGDATLPIATLGERLMALLPQRRGSIPSGPEILAALPAGETVQAGDVFGVLTAKLLDDSLHGVPQYTCAAAADGVTEIVVDCADPPIGSAAVEFAAGIVASASDEAWRETAAQHVKAASAQRAAFLAAAAARAVDFHTALLEAAARRRDIPVSYLDASRQVLLLGHGRKQQRLFRTLSDATSAIASRVAARDKSVTNHLLRKAGIPVPAQFVVRNRRELSESVARIGFPLVIKATTVDQGRAVTAGIADPAELERAVRKAASFRTPLIVEAHVPGDDHRLTVVGDRVVAAARLTPGHVVGDGTQSIRELIASENARRKERPTGLSRTIFLVLDADAAAILRRQGKTPDSVPVAGETVFLRAVANLAQGGITEDVTDRVHPEVAFAAVRAARQVGVAIAGIDIVATDISRPLVETGGAIVEINHIPAVTPHVLTPTPSPDVIAAMLDHLFPNGDAGRIPTVAVMGTGPEVETVCRLLVDLLGRGGRTIGLADATGASIGGRVVAPANGSRNDLFELLLRDPDLDGAVIALDGAELARVGFPFEACDVTVLTDTAEADPRVLARAVDLARRGVVLNEAVAGCADLARHARAPVSFFASDPGQAAAAAAAAIGTAPEEMRDFPGET
jgi:cyanophycin synthetase